jgi:hypothetical protein
MCCKQLQLISNEFHVLSATPRDMGCNMKQLPDHETIEWIVNELSPLRCPETEARAGVEMAIKLLRGDAPMRFPRPDSFPRANSIKKATRKLREAFGSFGDMQMPFWNGDQPMTVRDALDWFDGLEGPSSRVDILKSSVARQADCLVYQFSKRPPTAAATGKVSGVASILYQAFTGEEGVRLEHQIDAVRRSWKSAPDGSKLDELRCRGIPRL